MSSQVSLPLPPSNPTEIRRVAFLGTPEIAVPTLTAIVEAGYQVPLVVSGEDKRRGRGKEKSPTPVKALALEYGLAVSASVDDLLVEHERESIDLAVVVAFGQLIRTHVLAEIPMVNLHFSALPRWRGAAPVERAILAGDTDTAIDVITVAEGLDEGDIWAELPWTLEPEDTLHEVWHQMSLAGAKLIVDTMRSGFTDPIAQSGETVYAKKLRSEDLQIDWTRPASELHRIIRVGNAWTSFDGERFKIHEATVSDDARHAAGEIQDLVVGTGDGGLVLSVVQPAGKPRMDASAWANGAQPDGSSFDPIAE